MMKRVTVAAVLTVIGAISLAACSERSPVDLRVWTTPEGTPVPPSVIQVRTGAEHCGWEDIWFLSVGDPIGSERLVAETGRLAPGHMQFIQDPARKIDSPSLKDQFDPDAELPGDAEFTGFVSEGNELWVSTDQVNRAVYLVTESGVEKWPRAEPPIYCA